MTSVVASGITDKNKLSKLNEIAKKHNAVIKNERQHDMYVECKDLKTAKELSKIIANLK